MELQEETIYLINVGNFNVRKVGAYRLTKRGGKEHAQRWLIATAQEAKVYDSRVPIEGYIPCESPEAVADWLNAKAESLRQHLRNIYTELELYATMKPAAAK